eukprot:248770_1
MLPVIAFLSTLSPILVHSVCPFTLIGTPPNHYFPIPDSSDYDEAVKSLDIEAVFADIYALLPDSQDCWPADEFHLEEEDGGGSEASYGPLFVRLAWHCSGTHRDTDEQGGCAGGRQRFPPEASWPDNVNLDKARALLVPIKVKYGDALSWGDLMVFAGTASVLNMGGPVTEICCGRIDDYNGEKSEILELPECEDEGNCPEPQGADTTGLIYVNAAGVLGDPVPEKSAPRIREIFGRMGMNDEETVALIGGGHAFGKAHGACTAGAGDSPEDAPFNPWPGNCDTGMGEDTFSSGFEGQWTSHPLRWDNEFFQFLIEDDYELITGPGGMPQWENQRDNEYMMLTTDLALIYDDEYLEIVKSFAEDLDVLNAAFASAWEKLVTEGGSWSSSKKCVDAADLFVTTTEKPSEDDDDSPSYSSDDSSSYSGDDAFLLEVDGDENIWQIMEEEGDANVTVGLSDKTMASLWGIAIGLVLINVAIYLCFCRNKTKREAMEQDECASVSTL